MKLPKYFQFLVLVLPLLCCGLGQQAQAARVKLSNVSVVNDGTNVLRKRITFSSDQPGSVYLSWWENTVAPGVVRQSATVPVAENNTITINYLKAETNYLWQATVVLGSGELAQSKPMAFTTDTLPEGLPQLSIPQYEQADGVPFDGYILANAHEAPALLYIFDAAANILWYEYMDKYVRPVTLTPQGTLLTIRNHEEVLEINTLGETVWSSHLRGLEQGEQLHHDIISDGKGNYFTLGSVSKQITVPDGNGSKLLTIATDRLIRFNKEGAITWSWSLFDAVDPSRDAHAIEHPGDWGHANGLCFDAEGNVAVSFRLLDEVWCINPASGKVLWTLGENGTLKSSANGHFLKQHAPLFTAGNRLLVFDNGQEAVRPQSRVLELTLNFADKKAEPFTVINIPQFLSSLKRGSCYPVSERQFLVCSTDANRFFIINKQERITWQVETNTPAYRAIPLHKLP